MIQEHKNLLGMIGDAVKAAKALNGLGENLVNIERHLRKAADEVKGRIAYYEANQPAPVQAPTPDPADPKSLLMAKSKNQLLVIVEDWNTTPNQANPITLEPNANKSQIADAILAAQATAQKS